MRESLAGSGSFPFHRKETHARAVAFVISRSLAAVLEGDVTRGAMSASADFFLADAQGDRIATKRPAA